MRPLEVTVAGGKARRRCRQSALVPTIQGPQARRRQGRTGGDQDGDESSTTALASSWLDAGVTYHADIAGQSFCPQNLSYGMKVS